MKTVVLFLACMALVANVVFLIGWHLEFLSILQPPPATWPIPYSAVCCLLICNLAFLTLFIPLLPLLTKGLGLTIFLFGLQRVTLGCFALAPYACSMRVLAALGFMLVGLAYMLWPCNNNDLPKNIILLIITAVIIFLGSVGILTAILPLREHHEMQRGLLHFYTSIGFLLIGMGFGFMRARKRQVAS